MQQDFVTLPLSAQREANLLSKNMQDFCSLFSGKNKNVRKIQMNSRD